uniref:Uncharacterized protein n=1 Tax=Laticauda laticaudata TaxID=8630 RepID=A0A8C5SPY0_LATLA
MELAIKLLREALQNQQTNGQSSGSQGSQDLCQDKNRIRCLEQQLAQFQIESFNLRNCIEEAYLFLVDLKNIANLSKNHLEKLQEWIGVAQELRREASIPQVNSGTVVDQEGPYHITILQLKRELKKYQQALATDAEVFSEKELEIKILQDQIQKLIQENREYLESLREAQDTNRLQNEKMVEQRLIINQLNDKLEKMAKAPASNGASGDGPAAVISAKRPYSVPLTKSLMQMNNIPLRLDSRKVHTSPPMYSLSKVIAGFQTRNQIMMEHIEEQDEVLHYCFSDHSDDDDDDENSAKTGRKFRFRIYYVFLKQYTFFKGVDIEFIKKSQIINVQKLKNSELKLIAAKQKMNELTLNIRMKEELIKELVKTGNDARSVSQQYSLKITQLEHEAEQAKIDLAETQKQLQELENKELRDIAEKARLQKEFRKKMDTAKLKVQVIQKKQQETKNLASLSTQNEKRISELEQNINHMKNQQAQLQKKLREENEKKKILETGIQHDRTAGEDSKAKG